jgi:hypothetical protein
MIPIFIFWLGLYGFSKYYSLKPIESYILNLNEGLTF